MIFTAALVVGLGVRLVVLGHTAQLGTPIVDEQHYSRLAANLVAGNGFAMEPGHPTSIRPPLYPAFLAAVWSVAGIGNFQIVRALQMLLAALTAALVYVIGKRAYSDEVGRLAAVITWLYPSLVFSNYLILTETLFTLWLAAFVLLLLLYVQQPGPATAAACGAVLGLAALTRSVVWPVPIFLCPLLLCLPGTSPGKRVVGSALLLAGFVVVVGPWAVRNTRLQGVPTIVDTMGGLNLRMGNYEYTPEDRMWDAVSLEGERSWVYALTQEDHRGEQITEGWKDKWAQRKALEYMRAHPAITMRRSAIKFADMWGLDREFVAGVRSGFYAPPPWFEVVAAGAMIGGFVVVAIAAAIGIWIAPPPDWRSRLPLVFPVIFVLAAHSVAFGHSRYRLPLMPLLSIFAAALVVTGAQRRLRPSRPAYVAGALSALLLVTIWVRQLAFVDASLVAPILRQIGL